MIDDLGRKVLLLTDLRHYFTYRGAAASKLVVHAVDGVSISVERGSIFGLVGESGSGKSTVARCAVRLLEPTGGRVELLGTDVTHLSRRSMRKFRRDVHMVFQDALSSMNPRFTVDDIVAEPLRQNTDESRRSRQDTVREILEKVGIGLEYGERYPHELSGGQRQRVGIARALVLRPSLIVADEAVSALDVSVQASILNLLRDLQSDLGFSCLFITHDLSVVEHVSDRIAVMYLGEIVEQGSRDELFMRPQHPYTQALIAAAPFPDPIVQRERRRVLLSGEIPSPMSPPSGCRFRTRCPLAFDRCAEEVPAVQEVGGEPGHLVRCHLYSEGHDVPRLVR